MITGKKIDISIMLVFLFFMFYKPIVCGLIVGGLGLCHCIKSIYFFKQISKFGVESEGIIKSYETEDEGYKTPLVEFKTKSEVIILKKPHYYASTDLSKFRSYKNNLGKMVNVIYMPNNPEKFVIKAEKQFSYATLILFILICIFFIFLSLGNLLGFIKIDNF